MKYVHKKGRVVAGFREREKPYLADIQRCEVLLAPLAALPRDSREEAGLPAEDEEARMVGELGAVLV